MKRTLPFFALLWGLSAVQSIAQPLDQQQTAFASTNNYNSYEYIGQTFTPGISGPLSKITLKMYEVSGGSHIATLKIYLADGSGLPVTSNLLASTTCTVSGSAPTDYDYIFSTPYTVTAGMKYAMIISSSAGANGRFSYQNTDAYSGGTYVWKFAGSGSGNLVNTSDMYFKTYVGAIPLPVQWLSVSGMCKEDGQNVLQWKVAEYAVQSYDVEYSTDGAAFIPIARIGSKGDGVHEYEYVHTSNRAAEGYYRIKQKDHDGGYTYSATIALRTAVNNHKVQVYPTITTGRVMVNVSDRLVGTQAVLYSTQGIQLAVFPVNSNSFNIDLSAYAAGSYLLVFNDGTLARLIRN